MGQWARQFSGDTHDTRVEDAEQALCETVAEQVVPKEEWSDDVRSKLNKLTGKVLFAREHVLSSRLSNAKHIPTEEAFERRKLEQVRLSNSLKALRDGGVGPILREFGA